MLFKKKTAAENAEPMEAKQIAEQQEEEISDEKRTRTLTGWYDKGVTLLLILLGLYHIYVGFFGASSAMQLRATHWLIISFCLFFIYPATKKGLAKVSVIDWGWAILALLSSGYILLNWKRIASNTGMTNQTDIIFGIIAVLVVLEATRRAIGPVLAGLGVLFLAYAFLGHLIPGTLGHRQYSLNRIMSFMYTGTEGIYGTAMNVSAQYVALFVLFGAMLEMFGGGELFVDLAYSLTGKMRGGPAKASVVSSALMGTMSGSAVANVVTTGAFTIPLMKKNGYSPTSAGAVEAVASTGGQIMPPVMGAAAFLMAEMTGVSYGKICLAALIPALFYFLSIFLMVDLEAKREKIPVAEDSEIKPVGKVLKASGYLLLPLILLIALIVSGKSAIFSAAYSIAAILIVDIIFNKDRIHVLNRFFKAVAKGMRGVISVAAACACAGIICGIIQLTGIGSKFSSLMLSVAGDNIFIALLMTMLASLILGCGLPTTAAYMVLATLAVPALTKMGVPMVAAHLFVLYFGSISTITPPVALSAYAGAALAGANPNKVGFRAFRFGLIAFIIPFMFVYSPPLLLQGGAISIVQGVITGCIGVLCIAICVQGYLLAPAGVVERIAAFAAGLLLIFSGLVTDLIGFVLFAGIIVLQLIHKKKLTATPAT